MFVYNSCVRDARVLKEAKTLADSGHEVKIIAIMDTATPPFEEKDGFKIYRTRKLFQSMKSVDKDKARYNTASINSESSSSRLYKRTNETSDWRRKFLLSFYRPFAFLNYYFRAWAIIKNKQIDVYHCHDLNTLLLGYLAKHNNNKVKLIYDAHELSTEVAYIPWHEKLIWRKLERCLIRQADTVITPGVYRAKYFVEKYGIPMPEVVINCPAAVKQTQHSNYLRDQTCIQDTEPIILYQGGLISGRGLHNLILAMASIERGILVFMGWGIIEDDLKNLVKQHNLQDRVFFVPPVAPEQVVKHIAPADLGVVIYRFTGLNNYYASPNKLYEYINAGLPVVSSNFPALKDIVDEYKIGETFDPENPGSIAQTINSILSDIKKLERFKINAKKAAGIFNWENESLKLIKIYERLSN